MRRRPLLVALLAALGVATVGHAAAGGVSSGVAGEVAAAAQDDECAPRVVEDEYGVERLLDPCEPLPELGTTDGELFTPTGPVSPGPLDAWFGTPEARHLADTVGLLALEQPQCDGLGFLDEPWDPEQPDAGSLREVVEGALVSIPARDLATTLGAGMRAMVEAALPDCTSDPGAHARAHRAAVERASAALSAVGSP